jgi:hypothetical protein
LVDITVDGPPGASFRARGQWHGPSFDTYGANVHTSVSAVVGDGGTTALSYGPFVLGEGEASVVVSTPDADYFWCELDRTWRNAPFDGTPFHVSLGALAKFEPTDDGNVAIGTRGEIGDVVRRWVDEYTSDTPAFWELNEDPLLRYPLPVEPEVPAGLLPDFEWPNGTAELRYLHEDFVGVEGYADFARVDPQDHDGRALHRLDICL